MALETATHINGLNSSNPVSTDAISASEDHLRLIKATLLATFPNIAGAMNATHPADQLHRRQRYATAITNGQTTSSRR